VHYRNEKLQNEVSEVIQQKEFGNFLALQSRAVRQIDMENGERYISDATRPTNIQGRPYPCRGYNRVR
jgi:hypothetical protein